MFYALSWFLSFALLALWSLTCWGLHALTVWAVASAGALAGGSAALGASLWPDWVNFWIPPELAQVLQSMVASLGPMVQALLETVPFLSGAVSVLAWVIWGFGALTLLALAIGAHVLIAVLKRRRPVNAPAAREASATPLR
ncbi:hypothetical protein [Acidovorax sp. CCYZU-2555]|uniref:hypothetical protein n=1 Tax=Acidovorax sp. CCYZU-2555 TaxID=2835042 RepID=UPI001BCF45DD|nr:hypothetical protein [Acidovorax sp. CCYZU-2555]MBS7780042.1 hypothetical protein [Acidovorax sp. CCYZU-2555]